MDTSKAASVDCANCASQDFGDCPRCFAATGIGCDHGALCPDCAAETAAAATLGRKGGKAGRGEAKRRGDSAYYKALRTKRRCHLRTPWWPCVLPDGHEGNCKGPSSP